MRPVKTPHTNRIFKLPGGTKENDLPVFQTSDEYGNIWASTWELTEAERSKIASGGQITLWVWSIGHPPVALSVEGMDDQEEKSGTGTGNT